MHFDERCERYLRAVAERGGLTARQAAQLTGASEATVRRDFARLEADGVVERLRGRIALSPSERMAPFAFRSVRFSEEKAALARRAAALLKAGDVVFVDGGTTTFHLAGCLPDVPLQVVTNSLRLVEAMERRTGRKARQEIYLTGGLVYPKSGLLVGSGVRHGLRQYHANWTFLSVGGVTEDGLFNTNDRVVETEREMIQLAEQVVVLADHSKIGRYAMCHVCELDAIDYLVTDADPERSTLLPRIRKAGVKVLGPG